MYLQVHCSGTCQSYSLILLYTFQPILQPTVYSPALLIEIFVLFVFLHFLITVLFYEMLQKKNLALFILINYVALLITVVKMDLTET